MLSVSLHRTLLSYLVVFLIGSTTALAKTSETPNWNPFGEIPWSTFGNLPQSPNNILGTRALHLMAVDLIQAEGTPVYSVIDGEASVVALPTDSPYVVTVQIKRADGLLTYSMHIVPSDELKAATAPLSIKAGTQIGTITKPPGSIPAHIHFGAADCKKRLRLNPLQFLKMQDHEAPVIHEVFAIQNNEKITGPLSGKVDLLARISDHLDSANPTLYSPNRIEFEIRSKALAQRTLFKTILYDATTMPFEPKKNAPTNFTCDSFFEIDGYNPRIGGTLYPASNLKQINQAQGFLFSLTANLNALTENDRLWLKPHDGPWDTTLIPNGEYEVRVSASDISGNQNHFTQTFLIKN